LTSGCDATVDVPLSGRLGIAALCTGLRPAGMGEVRDMYDIADRVVSRAVFGIRAYRGVDSTASVTACDTGRWCRGNAVHLRSGWQLSRRG
jgi:chorismate synthase